MTKHVATHDGTCQICGSRQRLPFGLMAKHGYDVRFGFFNGVCNGSAAPPFEQSINLILDAIENALNRADVLRSEANAHRTAVSGNRTMYRVYLPATFADRRARYEWREVEVIATPKSASWGEWTDFTCDVVTRRSGGGAEVTETKRLDGRTLDEVVAAGRGRYAYHLEAEAVQFEQYAKWQEARIAGWAAKPLLPRTA